MDAYKNKSLVDGIYYIQHKTRGVILDICAGGLLCSKDENIVDIIDKVPPTPICSYRNDEIEELKTRIKDAEGVLSVFADGWKQLGLNAYEAYKRKYMENESDN